MERKKFPLENIGLKFQLQILSLVLPVQCKSKWHWSFWKPDFDWIDYNWAEKHPHCLFLSIISHSRMGCWMGPLWCGALARDLSPSLCSQPGSCVKDRLGIHFSMCSSVALCSCSGLLAMKAQKQMHKPNAVSRHIPPPLNLQGIYCLSLLLSVSSFPHPPSFSLISLWVFSGSF